MIKLILISIVILAAVLGAAYWLNGERGIMGEGGGRGEMGGVGGGGGEGEGGEIKGRKGKKREQMGKMGGMGYFDIPTYQLAIPTPDSDFLLGIPANLMSAPLMTITAGRFSSSARRAAALKASKFISSLLTNRPR